jgi:hypothetical protein
VVGTLTLGFAAVDLEAMRRRSMSRLHGVAVAVYVATWGVIFVYGLPVAPLGSLNYVVPFVVRLAVATVFGGGQLLAGLIREERLLTGKAERLPPVPRHELTAEELTEAERYDEEWQREDRRRERERRRHPDDDVPVP